MDMSMNRRRRLARTVMVAFLMTIALAIAPSASAAKPAPAATCALNPGDTAVSWKSYPRTTSVDIEWFDADGNLISAVAIIPTKAMHSMYTQQTPAGTAEFGVSFSDASGEFGVTGGGCS